MSVSACVITYNEHELILNCLNFLNSLSTVTEICLIDSFSKDRTWELVSEFKTQKSYKIKQQKFVNFGQQKNDCIDMATGKWILLIDADETYSYKINDFLNEMQVRNDLSHINAVRIMTLITYPDKWHYLNPSFLDPHIRVWRNKFCKYVGECHERLYDNANRDLHNCYDKDVLTLSQTIDYNCIYMLHHQRLKSREALIDKGKRWAELDMLRRSAKQLLPVHRMSWVELKEKAKEENFFPIPKRSWDIPT